MGIEIQLLSLNTNFWKNCSGNTPIKMFERKKWSDFTVKLIREDYDFILLQETNPFFALLMQETDIFSPNRNYYYDRECGPKHYLKYNNKNIYYHELYKVLTKERPNDHFWGTAIITKEKTENIEAYFYNERNEYIGSDYFGYESVMFYDFKLENGAIVTIVNIYKKGNDRKAERDEKGKIINYDVVYRYEDKFFEDLHKIKNKNNIIVFAGDLNLGKSKNDEYDKGGIIQRIEKYGFINKSKNIGRTMKKDYQNDYIFVNSNFSDNIDIKNVKKIEPPDFPNFIDHYGIECKIKL